MLERRLSGKGRPEKVSLAEELKGKYELKSWKCSESCYVQNVVKYYEFF